MRRVDHCNLVKADDITEDQFGINVCRLIFPVNLHTFAYLSRWPFRPHGRRQPNSTYEAFSITGFHGNEVNNVNHDMSYMVTREANSLGCSQYFEYVEDKVGMKQFNKAIGCYTLYETPGYEPEGYEQQPAELDDGAGLMVHNTNIVIALALGRIKRKQKKVPAVVSYVENVNIMIQEVITTNEVDHFEGFPEFFAD